MCAVTDLRVGAAFPTAHPLHPVAPGTFLPPDAAALLRQADVVLALDWVDLAGTLRQAFGTAAPTPTVICASDDDRLHNGWSKDHFALAPIDLGVRAHPDLFVEALLGVVGPRTPTAGWPPARTHPLAGQPRGSPITGGAGEADAITVSDVAMTLRRALAGRDACLVRVPLAWEGGDWTVAGPLDYLGQDGGAGLGSGPGMAVGAALALNGSDRIALAVLGDGDFLMGATALWSAARYRLPVLVVVANNRTYLNDEIHQERIARARARPVENRWVGQQIRDPDPDLAALARSLGLRGIGPVAGRGNLGAGSRRGTRRRPRRRARRRRRPRRPHGVPGHVRRVAARIRRVAGTRHASGGTDHRQRERALGTVTDRPVDKRSLPVLGDENKLKLALFGINLRGGVTLSDVEGKIEATWEENLRLSRYADRLGLDAVVPVARWRGYGGSSNLGERSFETFTWATGLLASTQRIQVFATFHVPLAHPVLAAKMVSTADHVSGGRFGLNIVAGWYTEELSMFGLAQREHDERYEVADEWAQVLKQLWTVPGERDFHGRYFDVPAGVLEPKPLQKPYPVIMNAGTSPAGRAFAAKHSDVIFAGLTNLDSAAQQIAEIKQLARDRFDREIRVFGRGHIVCRDSNAEAEREYDHVHRRVADYEGAANVTGISKLHSRSTDWSLDERKLLEGMIAGFWGIPMVGSPDQVAQQLIDLHGAGADGIAISFVNYDEGLDQLERRELLPRLVEAGVRHARPATGSIRS